MNIQADIDTIVKYFPAQEFSFTPFSPLFFNQFELNEDIEQTNLYFLYTDYLDQIELLTNKQSSMYPVQLSSNTIHIKDILEFENLLKNQQIQNKFYCMYDFIYIMNESKGQKKSTKCTPTFNLNDTNYFYKELNATCSGSNMDINCMAMNDKSVITATKFNTLQFKDRLDISETHMSILNHLKSKDSKKENNKHDVMSIKPLVPINTKCLNTTDAYKHYVLQYYYYNKMQMVDHI